LEIVFYRAFAKGTFDKKSYGRNDYGAGKIQPGTLMKVYFAGCERFSQELHLYDPKDNKFCATKKVYDMDARVAIFAHTRAKHARTTSHSTSLFFSLNCQ
jgi:hypothetical protein